MRRQSTESNDAFFLPHNLKCYLLSSELAGRKKALKHNHLILDHWQLWCANKVLCDGILIIFSAQVTFSIIGFNSLLVNFAYYCVIPCTSIYLFNKCDVEKGLSGDRKGGWGVSSLVISLLLYRYYQYVVFSVLYILVNVQFNIRAKYPFSVNVTWTMKRGKWECWR